MRTIAHHHTIPLLMATAFAGLAQPVITDQPNSLTNLVGTTATFSVAANGAPPLSYQWHLVNGFPLLTATNSDLLLSNVQSYQAGNYFVVVSDSAGSVTSTLATLTVLTPPRITGQPSDQAASLFADSTFLARAAGDAPLSYQWRLNGEDMPEMTNTTLSITNIQRANAGNYDMVVTNFSGSVTSQVAELTIVPFNSIYCFGFSWTDTHNCTWDPTLYWHNHACNGPMWPEFLSSNIGLTYLSSNNYAHCGATAIDVLNQVANFPVPRKPQLSLYFMWAGDSDFLRAYPPNGYGLGYLPVTNEVAWNGVIQTIISRNSNAVSQLYTKGARAIVIETLDDFSEEPGALLSFGTNVTGLSKLSEYITRCNVGFIDAMNAYSRSKPDLRILSLDILPKLNEVLANPAQYGFTKTTIDALDDLTNPSFAGPGADYVFWDSGHGTSKLNELFAAWHLELLTNSVPETLEVAIVSGLPTAQMNHLQIGRDYTLQSSSDLAHWNDVQTFTAAAGTNQWTGPSNGVAAAFYRLKWQP